MLAHLSISHTDLDYLVLKGSRRLGARLLDSVLIFAIPSCFVMISLIIVYLGKQLIGSILRSESNTVPFAKLTEDKLKIILISSSPLFGHSHLLMLPGISHTSFYKTTQERIAH